MNGTPIIAPAAPGQPKKPSILSELPDLCLRLLASYLTVLALSVAVGEGKAWQKVGTETFGLIPFILLVAGLFFLFTLLSLMLHDRLRTDPIVLVASSSLYAFSLAAVEENTLFSVLIAGVLCFLVAALIRTGMLEGPKKELSRPAAYAIVAICGILYAFFIGSVTAIRYLIYQAPNFDFGLFVNMFHNMAKTGLPNITSERDKLLSHFAVHFSPIYYLLLPAYLIFPSGTTLQIGQAVVLASSVIPAYMIARKLKLSRLASAGFCAVCVLYPALSGGCTYDLHENCFLTPLILWMFFFYLKDNTPLTFLFALLTMFVKEDAPIYVLFFGVYVLVEKFDRKHAAKGGGLIVFAAAYFVIVTTLMAANGEGIMAYRYKEYISEGGSIFSMIPNVVKNPALVFYNLAQKEKLEFILQTLVPLLFLPFITSKPARLVLACPYIMMNLMPSYQYQHDIYFQYTFGSFAFLLFASMLNYSDFAEKTKKWTLPCLVCASFVLFSGTVFASKNHYFGSYARSAELREHMEEVISYIPENASVRSSSFLLAHVAYRDEVYKIDTVNETEYALVDIRYNKKDYDMIKKLGWELVYESKGYAAVFRNPEYSKK